MSCISEVIPNFHFKTAIDKKYAIETEQYLMKVSIDIIFEVWATLTQFCNRCTIVIVNCDVASVMCCVLDGKPSALQGLENELKIPNLTKELGGSQMSLKRSPASRSSGSGSRSLLDSSNPSIANSPEVIKNDSISHKKMNMKLPLQETHLPSHSPKHAHTKQNRGRAAERRDKQKSVDMVQRQLENLDEGQLTSKDYVNMNPLEMPWNEVAMLNMSSEEETEEQRKNARKSAFRPYIENPKGNNSIGHLSKHSDLPPEPNTDQENVTSYKNRYEEACDDIVNQISPPLMNSAYLQSKRVSQNLLTNKSIGSHGLNDLNRPPESNISSQHLSKSNITPGKSHSSGRPSPDKRGHSSQSGLDVKGHRSQEGLDVKVKGHTSHPGVDGQRFHNNTGHKGSKSGIFIFIDILKLYLNFVIVFCLIINVNIETRVKIR